MAEKIQSTEKNAASDTERIFLQASSVGDSAAAVDELGFDLYVNAIADFLIAPNTHSPLTCSIEGSWGSGKSSFMLQLRNRLRAIDPNCCTIEFNAWKYDKQEELWAAFALKVTRSLRERMNWFHRIGRDLHLLFTRIKTWGQRLSLLAFVAAWILLIIGAGSVIYWTVQASRGERIKLVRSLVSSKENADADKTTKAEAPNPAQPSPAPLDPWYELLSWSPFATAAVLIVLLVGKLPEGLRKHLFEAQLERYIDRPDYKGKAAFVDAFSEDFAKVIESYTPRHGAKIFVFIDDLDRCEAPKAADLMQAINLMIGDGNPLIFILGLDRAKVAAAIAFKFREIVPYLDSSIKPTASPEEIRSFGDAFLEKFIQLSFRLPISSNEQQARKFIDSLITASPEDSAATPEPKNGDVTSIAESKRRALRIESGAESERIRNDVLMVREVLGYSPRRLKTFLNAFRLALYIASAQGLLDVDDATGESEITPERLAKFLALTMRYPELRPILSERPDFFKRMERAVLEGLVPHEDDQMSAWIEKRGIRGLMSYGIENKTETRSWGMRFSMRAFPTEKFDTILPSLPPPSSRPEPRRSGQQRMPAVPNNVEAESAFTSDPAPPPMPSRGTNAPSRYTEEESAFTSNAAPFPISNSKPASSAVEADERPRITKRPPPSSKSMKK